MDKKEKWVNLFEKIIGRKPNPQEFLAAKAGGFDFKQIKSIAGVAENADLKLSHEASESVQQVEEGDSATQFGNEVASATPNSEELNANKSLSRKKKIRRWLVVVALVLVAGLGITYHYFNSITGATVVAEDFKLAVSSNDYEQIASLLSNEKEKWTPEEAKAFITYLNDYEIDVLKEIDTIVASEGKNTYHDTHGNKLFGMEIFNKLYGIFPEYQIKTYPLEVKVITNMDDLTLESQKIEKNKEVSLGETKFVPTTYQVKGKTDLGDMDTRVTTDLQQAENNQLILSLATNTYKIKASLPDSMANATDIKLIVNGKEVANGLSKELKLMDNQEIDIHGIFNYEGTSYTTEKVTAIANPIQPELALELTLSNDVEQKIAIAKKIKEEKEEQERKDKETKDKIQAFMSEYIESMRSSITLRTVRFDKYFDTSSEVYNIYVKYIEDGGVERLKIDYQTTIDYTVTDVQKDGDSYVVTVHNKYREVFLDGKSSTVEKTQIFNLKPNGDSFLIYGVDKT